MLEKSKLYFLQLVTSCICLWKLEFDMLNQKIPWVVEKKVWSSLILTLYRKWRHSRVSLNLFFFLHVYKITKQNCNCLLPTCGNSFEPEALFFYTQAKSTEKWGLYLKMLLQAEMYSGRVDTVRRKGSFTLCSGSLKTTDLILDFAITVQRTLLSQNSWL